MVTVSIDFIMHFLFKPFFLKIKSMIFVIADQFDCAPI